MQIVLIGILICYMCYSLGRTFLGIFKVECQDDESFAISTGLGLGFTVFFVLGLGLSGLLIPVFLWGYLAVLAAFAAVKARRDFPHFLSAMKQLFAVSDVYSKLLLALAGLALVPVLLGITVPDTSNDSLCYHLHIPKVFLSLGCVGPIPHEVNALYPFFMEMLYVLGLGTFGLSLAQFFHFATGLLLVFSIIAYARRTVSIQYAWWAALLFLTSPLVINELPITYIDVGLAYFTWLALLSLIRWMETKKVGWLCLAGVFSGFILGIKYLALISVLFFFLIILWRLFRDKVKLKTGLMLLAIFCSLAVVLSAYWYLRSWIELGNPVYPFFAKFFGAGDPTIHYDDIGLKKDFFNLVRVFWVMSMSPQKFEGFGDQMGPMYLAFLPMAFLVLKRSKDSRYLLFFFLFFLSLWFFLGQSSRFFLSALPAAVILLSYGFAAYNAPGLKGKGLRSVVALLLILQTGVAFYHYRYIFKPGLGLESKAEYLSKEERTYSIADFTNRNLSPGSKILAADETHLFYFNHTIVRESIYYRDTGYSDGVASSDEVLDALERDGFTHVLLVTGGHRTPAASLDIYRIPRLISDEQDRLAQRLKLIYQQDFRDRNELQWNYQLYELAKKDKK